MVDVARSGLLAGVVTTAAVLVAQKAQELPSPVSLLARLAGYLGIGPQALVAAFVVVSAGGVVLAGVSAPPPAGMVTAGPTTHSNCPQIQQFTSPYLSEWSGFVEGEDFVSLGVLSFLSTQLGLVVDDAEAAGVHWLIRPMTGFGSWPSVQKGLRRPISLIVANSMMSAGLKCWSVLPDGCLMPTPLVLGG